MWPIAPLLAVLLGLPAAIPRQVSQPAVQCVTSQTAIVDTSGADCVVSQASTRAGLSTGGSSSTSSSGPAKRYIPYDHLKVGPDGKVCIEILYGEDPPPPSSTPLGVAHSDFMTDLYPMCPAEPEQPARAGAPASVDTPLVVATTYWERVPLPKPQPYIAPGRAITGKLAYLETRNATTFTYTNETPFGPLEIVATARYYVDWGDGNNTGPHSTEGGPWPDGTITHQYIDVGSYDVVVTERWTATWRLAGSSGILRELRSVGRIQNFPVQQIQAVISRG